MNREPVAVFRSPAPHWVGDGFPARTLFSYDRLGRLVSPFLLLDYAGPAEFDPTEKQRGVGEHPHRGFETVTIVYEARSRIGTPPAAAAPSARATCSG